MAPVAEITAPPGDGCLRIGEERRAVDEEQWPALDANIVWVQQDRLGIADECEVVFRGMFLGDQDFPIEPVPAAGPVLVCPADTEGKIGPAGFQNPPDWQVEEHLPCKPIVIETESENAVGARKTCLFFEHLCLAQIVIAKTCRDARLIVSWELRSAPSHICPFREAGSPPRVVLRDGMKLRQVKGDGFDLRIEWRFGCRSFGSGNLNIGLKWFEVEIIGRPDPPLLESGRDEVCQRFDPGLGDIRIGGQVKPGIKFRVGAMPFFPPLGEIVPQRIVADEDRARISLPVKLRIECRVRRAALSHSGSRIVFERIEVRAGHLRVLLQIPFGVEERVRIATLRCPAIEVVRERVFAARAHVGVMIEIPLLIKERQIALGEPGSYAFFRCSVLPHNRSRRHSD